MKVEVTFEVDLDHFRYTLINGASEFSKEEVERFSYPLLVSMLEQKVNRRIEGKYNKFIEEQEMKK